MQTTRAQDTTHHDQERAAVGGTTEDLVPGEEPTTPPLDWQNNREEPRHPAWQSAWQEGEPACSPAPEEDEGSADMANRTNCARRGDGNCRGVYREGTISVTVTGSMDGNGSTSEESEHETDSVYGDVNGRHEARVREERELLEECEGMSECMEISSEEGESQAEEGEGGREEHKASRKTNETESCRNRSKGEGVERGRQVHKEETRYQDKLLQDTTTGKITQQLQNMFEYIQAMKQDAHTDAELIREDMHDNQREIKQEIQAIQQEVQNIQTHTQNSLDRLEDRLEGLEGKIQGTQDTLVDIGQDIKATRAQVQENKESITLLQNKQEETHTMQEHIQRQIEELRSQNKDLQDEIDRLDSNTRINNLILYGMAETVGQGMWEHTENLVTSMLHYHMPEGNWQRQDISQAQRLGRRKGMGRGRPILIKFAKPGDAQWVLSNRERREEMKTRGLELAQDLTRRQMKQLQEIRGSGREGILVRGKIQVKGEGRLNIRRGIREGGGRDERECMAKGQNCQRDTHRHPTAIQEQITQTNTSPTRQAAQKQHPAVSHLHDRPTDQHQQAIPTTGSNQTGYLPLNASDPNKNSSPNQLTLSQTSETGQDSTPTRAHSDRDEPVGIWNIPTQDYTTESEAEDCIRTTKDSSMHGREHLKESGKEERKSEKEERQTEKGIDKSKDGEDF